MPQISVHDVHHDGIYFVAKSLRGIIMGYGTFRLNADGSSEIISGVVNAGPSSFLNRRIAMRVSGAIGDAYIS